jgi:hypothetical protein
MAHGNIAYDNATFSFWLEAKTNDPGHQGL